jgi:hypothetical protein
VQSSGFRFGVFSFVPKTPIFAFKTRLNQPSTDYQNEKNKTISNYPRKAQAPTTKLKTESTPESSKSEQ